MEYMRKVGGVPTDAGNYRWAKATPTCFKVISGGSAGTEMPAFGGQPGERSLWRLVTYSER